MYDFFIFFHVFEKWTWYEFRIFQVGFAELKETADYRADNGGTIISATIVGQ